MELQLYRSLWTTGFDVDRALADVTAGDFDGIEGPLPRDEKCRRDFVHRITTTGVPWIAEIATGGGYVPTERSAAAHLDELRREIDAAREARPLFVTALAGCDAWPANSAVEFFGRAMDAARERSVEISFETHRSRPTFSPWATATLLRQLPALQLTCDFSHWCCVCERLVLDEEPGLLAAFARHARHIHARVGYAQGPQVPHPAAPEFQGALAAHERWWEVLFSARAPKSRVTITPEFGADGYLQTVPFSGRPVGDLDEINRWMADWLRARFGDKATSVVGGGV